MANQMGTFSPNLAQVMQPLRELMSKNRSWQWGCAQEAFAQVKAELYKPTMLAFYTPDSPTRLSADATSHVGAVFLQRSDGEKKPVAYASRGLCQIPKSRKKHWLLSGRVKILPAIPMDLNSTSKLITSRRSFHL